MNESLNRWQMAPTIDISRSSFNRNSSVKTTFNVGELIPFYVDEVVPGDTHKIRTSKVVRLQTLLTPIMDNLYLDTYYFFVPNRLVWEHWREFNGENTKSAWYPSVEYEIPVVKSPASTGWDVGTIADYMGIPTGVTDLEVNALPLRAYGLIVNEWFRDQNLEDPVVIPVGDASVDGVNTGSYKTDIVKGGLPFVAAKYHDYFTSALPAPQKGPDVPLPLGDDVPVYGSGYALGITDGTNKAGLRAYPSGTGYSKDLFAATQGYGKQVGSTASAGEISPLSDTKWLGVVEKDTDVISGLYADMSQVTAATVNQLRIAFQVQRLYEKDARGGTRYTELLRSHFGVTSPDSRLQRPEYLGGNRVPLNVHQVVQSSGTKSGTTPQGHVTAYSQTGDANNDFVQSFTEHGYIIGLMCVRYDHSYQQGLERHWSRRSRFDYYWPVLANIGEQGVRNSEIYAQGSSVVNDDGDPIDGEIFGYQEAWADLRHKPNIITGQMRSMAATAFDAWHLADNYSELPVLSPTWIKEDKSNVDRVLAVSSSVANQIWADLYIENNTTRPLPVYSIPGLIDHN